MPDRPWNESNTLRESADRTEIEEIRDVILGELVKAFNRIYHKYRNSEYNIADIIDSCIEEASIKASDLYD